MVKAVANNPAKPASPGKATKPITKDLPEKKKFAVQANGKKVPVEPVAKPEPKKQEKTNQSKKQDAKPAKKPAQEPKEKKEPKPKQKVEKSEESEDESKQDEDDRLPGQRYPTPDDGEGTRLFYESMYEQKQGNKFAEKWLLEHGCLPIEKATQLANLLKKKK